MYTQTGLLLNIVLVYTFYISLCICIATSSTLLCFSHIFTSILKSLSVDFPSQKEKTLLNCSQSTNLKPPNLVNKRYIPRNLKFITTTTKKETPRNSSFCVVRSVVYHLPQQSYCSNMNFKLSSP